MGGLYAILIHGGGLYLIVLQRRFIPNHRTTLPNTDTKTRTHQTDTKYKPVMEPDLLIIFILFLAPDLTKFWFLLLTTVLSPRIHQVFIELHIHFAQLLLWP